MSDNEHGDGTTDDAPQYHLQSEPSHFYAGRLPDGAQALMTVDAPDLVLIRFGTGGDFLEAATRPISQALLSQAENMAWYGYDKFWEELDAWANEIGLIRERIAVKPFFLPEYPVGIKDLPDEYQAFLDGTDVGDDWSEEVQRWWGEGDFVFVWGQEYWMNREGEVTST